MLLLNTSHKILARIDLDQVADFIHLKKYWYMYKAIYFVI
jgi:hypothetical protein